MADETEFDKEQIRIKVKAAKDIAQGICKKHPELGQAGGVEPLMSLRAKGSEHEGHESTRNTRKEVLSASRLSCLSRPFAAFVIQTALDTLSDRGSLGGSKQKEKNHGNQRYEWLDRFLNGAT